MAGAITYNTALTNVAYIYRATSGGTVFSANLVGATFDYFTDTFVVNDAIYFAKAASNLFSDLVVNVGTPIAGTGITGVWEYYNAGAAAWQPVLRMVDGTAGFTNYGSNRVKFPYQNNANYTTVNSVFSFWVRYRITAYTTRTEGGANITSIPQVSNGMVAVTGYTVGAECTLTDIYNYMNTNYPYVGCVKNGAYFDFRWVSIDFSSPTLSINEILEIGFSTSGVGTLPSYWNFNFWTTGTLVGNNHGKNGSTIIINAVKNSYQYSFTSNQKSYGAAYLSRPNFDSGYPSISGIFYDCTLQLSPGSLGNGDCSNCTFFIGFGFIANGSWATSANNPFYNNKFIITGGNSWSAYSISFNIPNANIIFDGNGKYVIGSQQNNGPGLIWNFSDPVNPLPGISDLNKPMYIYKGSIVNIANVFFYDDSSGTYTDYTTQASSATTGDIPIHGDVGDCLYFNMLAVVSDLMHPYITSTLGGINDYVYVWEYYKTSAFKSFSYQWDMSNNLTTTGEVWFERSLNDITLTTINGVSGYWYRLRIITKGTGTPMVDKIQKRSCSGTSTWKFNEQFTINYKAMDSNGNNLQDVVVTAVDKWGTVQFAGTTGLNGTIAASKVITRQWRFDPFDSGRDTINNVAEKLYNQFIFTSRKYGYLPIIQNVTIASTQNPVNAFQGNLYIVASSAVAGAYTGISINGATNLIIISQDHTIQEIYDYSQWWASQSANMGYVEPFVTADGVNYTSTYDLTISANLSGTGKINIGAKTLTMSGTSTLDIVAVDGTHTNIKLTNLVSGSRVQLYDVTSAAELYNAVVGATSLTFPIVWTVDHTIRVRVMYVSGITAKQWYETTGTLANTGLSININQVDDSVYNFIGIDGSTVTECSIVGAIIVINIDDPDNTTTAQRLYAYEVSWLFTEGGIRDQSLYIDATDSTHFTFEGGLKIKNLDLSNPLQITGGNIVPVNGIATEVFDLAGGTIFLNFNRVEGFAYMTEGGLTAQQAEKLSNIPSNPLLTDDARLNNLDTTVSSRSSQTSLDSLQTSNAQDVWEYADRQLTNNVTNIEFSKAEDKTIEVGQETTRIIEVVTENNTVKAETTNNNTIIEVVIEPQTVIEVIK